MSMLIPILLWLIIGSSTAYFAQQRGRDPYAWFAIGILLGLIGLLLLFLLPLHGAEAEKKTADLDRVSLDASPSTLPENDWFCVDKSKKQQGPLSLSMLTTLWRQGEIDAHSFVWCPSMSGWEQIEKNVTLLKSLTINTL